MAGAAGDCCLMLLIAAIELGVDLVVASTSVSVRKGRLAVRSTALYL